MKSMKYTLYITFCVSAFWGVFRNMNTILYNTGIDFHIADLIFAVLFLLSMILLPMLLMKKGKGKGIIRFFLYYWILLIATYHIGDLFHIKWLEKASECIMLPFYSMFPIVWEFTDGETATVIGLIFAYYIVPFLMMIYLFIMLMLMKNKYNIDISSNE